MATLILWNPFFFLIIIKTFFLIEPSQKSSCRGLTRNCPLFQGPLLISLKIFKDPLFTLVTKNCLTPPNHPAAFCMLEHLHFVEFFTFFFHKFWYSPWGVISVFWTSLNLLSLYASVWTPFVLLFRICSSTYEYWKTRWGNSKVYQYC